MGKVPGQEGDRGDVAVPESPDDELVEEAEQEPGVDRACGDGGDEAEAEDLEPQRGQAAGSPARVPGRGDVGYCGPPDRRADTAMTAQPR